MYKLMHELSTGANMYDLEWPPSEIVRQRQFLFIYLFILSIRV